MQRNMRRIGHRASTMMMIMMLMVGWLLNDDLKCIRKEATMTKWKYSSGIRLEELRKNKKNLGQDSRCRSRNSNWKSPEYESRTSHATPTSSMPLNWAEFVALSIMYQWIKPVNVTIAFSNVLKDHRDLCKPYVIY
jgi:hypothetical protein